MPTTANFGLRYPGTGVSPNGKVQIRELAEDVDAAFADFPGDLASHDARLDDLEQLPQPGQVVYFGRRVNVQEIANIAASLNATRIAWDETVYDPLPNGMREAPPNNTRIQPPVAGYYRFEGRGSVHAATSPGDTNRARDCGWVKNDTVLVSGGIGRTLVVFVDGGADTVSMTCEAGTVIVPMNGTTDYMEMFLQQASGGPLNTVTGTGYEPAIVVTYVGPL